MKKYTIFRIAAYIAHAYFISQVSLTRDATRPAALSNFFMKMTHTKYGGRFRVRCLVLGKVRRILIPERPAASSAGRPNYDGIYEPLRRAPGKISSPDIYLRAHARLHAARSAFIAKDFSQAPPRRGERSSLKLFLDRCHGFPSLFSS